MKPKSKPRAKPKAAQKPQAEPVPATVPIATAPAPEPKPRLGREPIKDKPVSLTQAMADAILSDIREGAYPWQAARRHGIPAATWYEWLKRGRGGVVKNDVRAPQNLIDFVQRVEEAEAAACVVASIDVYTNNKLAWLLKGPGRERPGKPGWADKNIPENADADKPVESGENRSASMALFERIKDRLSDDELADYLAIGRKNDEAAED